MQIKENSFGLLNHAGSRQELTGMKAADVMISKVITVGPKASIQEVADILLANRISAVPVVGERGEVIGMISEGDLLRRIETGTERRSLWWLELLIGRRSLDAEYVKSRARTAADVMTREVVTAALDTPLRDIAALLERNCIKRVPILRHGELVGIVSRANLIQALATERKEIKASTATSDLMIRQDVMARLDAEPWARSSPLNATVHDGTVELWGVVRSSKAKEAVHVAVELTPGVRAVNNNLVVEPVMSVLRSVVAAL
jgi:CBS domain-containing protein